MSPVSSRAMTEIQPARRYVTTQKARRRQVRGKARPAASWQKAQSLANAKQAALGAFGGLQPIPFRAAHSAQINGIRSLAFIDCGLGKRLSRGIHSRAAQKGFLKNEFMAEFLATGFQRKLSWAIISGPMPSPGRRQVVFSSLIFLFHAFSDIANQAAGLENNAHRFGSGWKL